MILNGFLLYDFCGARIGRHLEPISVGNRNLLEAVRLLKQALNIKAGTGYLARLSRYCLYLFIADIVLTDLSGPEKTGIPS